MLKGGILSEEGPFVRLHEVSDRACRPRILEPGPVHFSSPPEGENLGRAKS